MPLLPTENCLKVVVGSKTDLLQSESERQVTRQEARQFCSEINEQLLAKTGNTELPFFETSSKTGENVQETFEYIFQKCLSPLSDEYRLKSRNTIKLHSRPVQENTTKTAADKKCCLTH